LAHASCLFELTVTTLSCHKQIELTQIVILPNLNPSTSFVFICVLVCVLWASPATAQVPSLTTADADTTEINRVVFGFIPVVAYSSDHGLVGGGLGSRFDYRIGSNPFRSSMQLAGLVTTSGLFSLMFVSDFTTTMGLPVRSWQRLNTGLQNNTSWFGIGNNTSFETELWEQDYYFFRSVYLMHEYRGRKRIWQDTQVSTRYLDVLGIIDIRYLRPYVTDKVNLLADQGLDATGGSWVWLMGTGLQWESRDNEIAPSSGSSVSVIMLGAPGLVADYRMWWFNTLASAYTTRKIVFPVTLALRAAWYQSGGDVPFFALPELGGMYTLRGYPQGRFRNDAMMHYTVELRTWLVQLPQYGFRMGGNLFYDGGRTYENERIVRDFFADHKSTFGFGGAMSLFTYDFLVRAELGFSEDMMRLYMGIGFTF
jgi:hypothetical protein